MDPIRPTSCSCIPLTQKGCPMDIPETLKLYCSRRTELSTLNGCLLWENRVVIPEPGRRQLLNELHQAHI